MYPRSHFATAHLVVSELWQRTHNSIIAADRVQRNIVSQTNVRTLVANGVAELWAYSFVQGVPQMITVR